MRSLTNLSPMFSSLGRVKEGLCLSYTTNFSSLCKGGGNNPFLSLLRNPALHFPSYVCLEDFNLPLGDENFSTYTLNIESPTLYPSPNSNAIDPQQLGYLILCVKIIKNFHQIPPKRLDTLCNSVLYYVIGRTYR